MNPAHAAFIAAEITRYRREIMNEADLDVSTIVRGQCMHMSNALAEAFPGELTVVLGFCNGAEHAWAVTASGEIVDGTAAQFEPPHDYEAYDPAKHVVKIGRCMECGDTIYGKLTDPPKSLCNDECERAFAASF